MEDYPKIRFDTVERSLEIEFRPTFDGCHMQYKGTGYGGNGRALLFLYEIWRESTSEINFFDRVIDTMNHEIFEALDVPHEWIEEMDLECRRDIPLPPLPPGFGKIDRELLLKTRRCV